MRRALAALDRHWFAPARVADLATARIALVGSQLLLFLPEHIELTLQAARIEEGPGLFVPLPLLKVLLSPIGWGARPSLALVGAVAAAAVVSGIGALVGFFTRVCLTIFATTNLFVMAHYYSYGEQHHPEALMMLALCALALGPSGGALSIDAWRARRGGAPIAASSPAARWPLRLVQWLMVLAYLSAGGSKLAHGGLEWVNGHTLAYYLAQDGIRWDRPLGVWLSHFPRVLALAGVGALLFELTFVLALLPRLTWLYVISGTALHIGIWLVQEATFFQYIFVYSVFLEPLRQGLSDLRRRRSRSGLVRQIRT